MPTLQRFLILKADLSSFSGPVYRPVVAFGLEIYQLIWEQDTSKSSSGNDSQATSVGCEEAESCLVGKVSHNHSNTEVAPAYQLCIALHIQPEEHIVCDITRILVLLQFSRATIGYR